MNRFSDWWDIVLVKKGKAEALKVWKARKLDEKADEIIAAYKKQLTWPEFAGERIQFMPQPPRWLRGEHWEDEPTPIAQHPLMVELPPDTPEERLARVRERYAKRI